MLHGHERAGNLPIDDALEYVSSIRTPLSILFLFFLHLRWPLPVPIAH